MTSAEATSIQSSTPVKPNRKQRRAQNKKSKVKRKVTPSVITGPSGENLTLQQQIVSLARQLESVRLAFNNNHKLYANTLTSLELRVNCLVKVIDGLHAGDVRKNDEGLIDWESYGKAEVEAMQKAEEERLKARQEAKAPPQVSEEEVFGGDYGTGTSTGGDRQVSESGEP